MSIHTDLASIKMIAQVLTSQDLKKTFAELVTHLQSNVQYFDWVGLYLTQGDELVLEAASDLEENLMWETNAELRIPISDLNSMELGKIVVRSHQPICFDMTDVTTLEKLAKEISARLSMN
ncbi:hypothetical protein [Caldalkalibacillus mannanilyticus]|uniref:hypothetical protein n=1 Tax=Caldalkalibacillus mannanilyticus TaxID=1418 RepID=UPI0004682852|nr:hypothetical protein [Caldalkalibacillus mannanilyticus]